MRQKTSEVIRLVYHLNPLSFLAVFIRWTNIFEFTLGLAAVHLFVSLKQAYGGLALALAVYLNPSMIVLIVPISCTAVSNGVKVRTLIKPFLITFIGIIGLLYTSFALTGTTNFLVNAYLRAYSPTLFQPSCGLIWSLFSGMFTKYQELYHFIFFLLPICHLFPLFKIFSKGITQNGFKIGLYGFISGVVLFVSFLHFSFVTIYDLNVIWLLLFTAYEYFHQIQIIIILVAAPTIIMTLTVFLGMIWFYNYAGNANYVFFQILVSSAFAVILVTEAMKNFACQKFDEDKAKEKEQEALKDKKTEELGNEKNEQEEKKKKE